MSSNDLRNKYYKELSIDLSFNIVELAVWLVHLSDVQKHYYKLKK